MRTSPAAFALLLVMLCPLSACGPLLYYAEPIHGTVVDSETQQPLIGAVVVAQWVVGKGPRAEPHTYELSEALTDPDGRYTLPGWGPRLRPLNARFYYSAPRLIVFKNGFVPAFFDNRNGGDCMVHSSEWNGKPLQISPFHGGADDRAQQLLNLINVCRDRRDSHGQALPELYHELLKEMPHAGKERLVVIDEDAKMCIEGK